jgi:hypothetical protein
MAGEWAAWWIYTMWQTERDLAHAGKNKAPSKNGALQVPGK